MEGQGRAGRDRGYGTEDYGVKAGEESSHDDESIGNEMTRRSYIGLSGGDRLGQIG